MVLGIFITVYFFLQINHVHLVCDFPFTDDHIDSLETSLSPGRMWLYRKQATEHGITANEIDAEALKLYCWNAALTRALYWPLHGFEITLRNALADRICDKYGDDWFDKIDTLKRGNAQKEIENVESAKARLAKNSEPINHDTVVAAVSLGFWAELLEPQYEKMLWVPDGMFSSLFPQDPQITRENIDQLKQLRNNVAHHEPVFIYWPPRPHKKNKKEYRQLFKDYKKTIKVIRWICPETAKWVEHHSAGEFFSVWNSAPAWLTKHIKLQVRPNGTTSQSDHWCWDDPDRPRSQK